MSDQELEDLAYNYGITRQESVRSSGTATFRTSTKPTQDILVAVGQVVTTEPDERLQKVSFTATAERTMTVANISDFYNATTGYYELDVPVQCTEAGITGNVGVGTIKLIEGSIPGINDVYNYSSFTNVPSIVLPVRFFMTL